MKRGTTQHPKMWMFAGKLGVPIFSAVGILETLWHFAAEYAPGGDVGKYPDSLIAQKIGWVDDPEKLIAALIETGWIDAADDHRLIVHDWPDHCEDAVHLKLARAVEYFANGAMPKLTRLVKDEKESICEKYAQKTHASTQETHENTLPSPTLPCPALTLPSQAKPDPAGQSPRRASAEPEPADGSESGVNSQAGGVGSGRGGCNLAPELQRVMAMQHRHQAGREIREKLEALGITSEATIGSIVGKRGLTVKIVDQVAAEVGNDPGVTDDAGAIVYRLRNGSLRDGRWVVPRKARA